MWYVILLTGIVAFLIYGFASRNNNAEVRLKIATFGFDISVYNLRLGDDWFWTDVVFCDQREKMHFSGRSIGEVQYNISKECKKRAQKRDGNNFKKYKTDYRSFNVGVTKDGERLTYSQYINLTTSKMRSTKNPIVRIERKELGPPTYGYYEDTHRAKL